MSSYKLPRDQVLRMMGVAKGDDADNLYYDTLERLATSIIEYRRENKETNKELSDRCGITTSVLSRVESGNQNISLKTICKILNAAGMHIEFVKNDPKSNK